MNWFKCSQMPLCPKTWIGRIQLTPVFPSQMHPTQSVFSELHVCMIPQRTNRCVLASCSTQFCSVFFFFLMKIFERLGFKLYSLKSWSEKLLGLQLWVLCKTHISIQAIKSYGMDSKQAAPDLFPETHDILFRAVRLFDVGVSMRLNILHFQNRFGFYCLAWVILWENKKVIRDNVSSKLCVWKTEAIFRECG